MRKQFGNYYLGLDIGTNSVGWAVTDPEYNILRFNGKAMWGIHLFNEGKTAEERRQHRCSRRRLDRRKQRIGLLRELFDQEICAVDPSFFERLDESNLVTKDRKTGQPNSIFNDPSFADKDYHKRFPTIYHLRKYLMTVDERPDIRLVYLAAHHIIKNRGHFLFEGLTNEALPEFEPIFEELLVKTSEEMGLIFEVNETLTDIKNVILDRNIGLSEKKKKLSELMVSQDDRQKAFITILAGGTSKLNALFTDIDKTDSEEIGSISLKNTSLEDNHSAIEGALGEGCTAILDLMKAVYDWGVLSGMLNGHKYLSDAKIDEYEQHKKDLYALKTLLKAYAAEHDNDFSLYNEVLKSAAANNYCSYSGMVKGSKDGAAVKFCTQEDFCKYLKSKIPAELFEKCDATKDMYARIENCTFMPKQRTKDNSVLPNALHRMELNAILDNMEKYYPFLLEKDEKGTSVREKIEDLCVFRIPYYIGPLNPASKNAWAVHTSDGKVTPWNFEDKIDIEKSSEEFIGRLVSRCTYLVAEKVLPKSSLLYHRFKLYNEINNISINGTRIEPSLKKDLIEELFVKKQAPVNKKKIAEFITARTGEKDVTITGIDEKVQSSLKLEKQFKDILGEDIKHHRFVEDLIRTATIFGDDRKRLKQKLGADYKEKLSKQQIEKLATIKFADWGNLSEKLLTGIVSKFPDGSELNIITALEQTNLNLMELLSDKYTYRQQIDRMNADVTGASDGKITYSMVDELYCSPAVKHSIWRTLSIIKEIVKITGHDPKKVFIETTREARDDGRKISRKDDLLKRYDDMPFVESNAEIIASLKTADNARLRSKKLYAYYCQEGHCMYCGKKIDLNDIGNNTICDIDHIYPQSKVTDDGISNMVLACRDCNITKSDRYPISPEIQKKMVGFWSHLKDSKLITEEKYKRLVRKDGFSDDELNKFVARQLVETSQSVKAIAETLKRTFVEDTDIVYVKGGNVSQFRQTYKDRGLYTKCRNVNDLHHAKDAYLNIVVGNVYDAKFTKDPMHVIRSGNYNLNRMFEKDVVRNGEMAWKSGDNGTILTIDKFMRRNNILFTRAPYKETGQLYNVTILKKGTKNVHPIKIDLDTDTYGGYGSVSGSFFSLVEHTLKKKRVRSIEYVPVMDSDKVLTSEDVNRYFEGRGLKDPSVRIRCVRIDSLFEIDGFRYHLSGRTGSSLIFKLAQELILPYDIHNYCKNIYKYTDDKKNNRSCAIKVEDYGITHEMNICTYSAIVEKLSTVYADVISIASIAQTVIENSDKFNQLSVEDQTQCINNILLILQCDATKSDLSMINGPSVCGAVRISKNIGDEKDVFIIHQSKTGLFERKLKLSEV